MEDIERHFWSKVVIKEANECWPWIGRQSHDGYGIFDMPVENDTRKFRNRTAHRCAYQFIHRTILGNYLDEQIDHLCRNRLCCNPSHMQVVSISENIRRGEVSLVAKRRALTRTHCPLGHPYDELNTYIRPGKPRGRECRICKNKAMKVAYLKRKERVKNGTDSSP